jgi:hypothetical protein
MGVLASGRTAATCGGGGLFRRIGTGEGRAPDPWGSASAGKVHPSSTISSSDQVPRFGASDDRSAGGSDEAGPAGSLGEMLVRSTSALSLFLTADGSRSAARFFRSRMRSSIFESSDAIATTSPISP